MSNYLLQSTFMLPSWHVWYYPWFTWVRHVIKCWMNVVNMTCDVRMNEANSKTSNVRQQQPVVFKLLFILAQPPTHRVGNGWLQASCCFSLQTCLRRWSPWQCSSPWAFTTRGRLRWWTDLWEQWGRQPICATGTLLSVFITLLCSACARQW